MNAWEGQVLAIAIKELLEAVKTLGRDGFGFRRDRAILSAVIRDLLSQTPNLSRAQASLNEVESIGVRRLPEYYVAQDLLAKIRAAQAEPAESAESVPANAPDTTNTNRDEAAANRVLTGRASAAGSMKKKSRQSPAPPLRGRGRPFSLLERRPADETGSPHDRGRSDERPLSRVAEPAEPYSAGSSAPPPKPSRPPRDNS